VQLLGYLASCLGHIRHLRTLKQVTVHFSDGAMPEKIDFQTFKQRYTIDPGEAKKLEELQKQAFPNQKLKQ
jgi:hypothetical protein